MTARETVVTETATEYVLSCGQGVVPTATSWKSVVAETASIDVFSCGQSAVRTEASVKLSRIQCISQ